MAWPADLPRIPLPAPRWEFLDPDPGAVEALAREAGVPRLCAAALVLRGAGDPDRARAFLNPRLQDLRDPWTLRDMDRAVARTLRAVEASEPICIYGDYDADGMTAAALLLRFLREVGTPASAFLPQRMRDGYGLNGERLAALRGEGARLFVAVDCGTRSLDEARVLRESGADLVVLDHHLPGDTLPEVAALVNPHRPDCPFPFKGLASVGIAFYFAGAVRRALIRAGRLREDDADPRALLDLVAIGTVADVVPLTDDNRILVHAGLKRIHASPSPGVAALRAVAGVADRPVTAGVLGFQIGPRLNAVGRLGDPAVALDLLVARDAEEATRLAAILDRENESRRRIEAEVLDQALRQVLEGDALAHRLLVVAGAGWHPGVVGIVAARLVEAFHRPAVVIGVADGEGRGSCRSVPGFDIGRAVTSLGDLVVRAGGHSLAAGLTVEEGRVGEVVAALRAAGDRDVPDEVLTPRLRIDAVARGPDLTPDLVERLQDLQPHGVGNPEPVFALMGARVAEARLVGRDRQHVQMVVEHEGARLGAIWFRGADNGGAGLSAGDGAAGEGAGPDRGSVGGGGGWTGRTVDVAFTLTLDDRTGAPRLKVRDARVV